MGSGKGKEKDIYIYNMLYLWAYAIYGNIKQYVLKLGYFLSPRGSTSKECYRCRCSYGNYSIDQDTVDTVD